MAIPSHLKVTPTSGSGNASISIKSATTHTGRVIRQTNNMRVTATSDASAFGTITVVEEAKPMFITLKQNSSSIDQDGGKVNITGTSNAAMINAAITSDDIGIKLPKTYNVGGSTATLGTAIPQDPGAVAQYNWSIAITVPAHTDITSHRAVITITPDKTPASAVTFTINQTAADAYLWLNTENNSTATVTIPQANTAQSVSVLSNDNWSVDVV